MLETNEPNFNLTLVFMQGESLEFFWSGGRRRVLEECGGLCGVCLPSQALFRLGPKNLRSFLSNDSALIVWHSQTVSTSQPNLDSFLRDF
jgi:hypothetical protein